MLTALLTTLAPLVVAVWAIGRLRARRTLLRELRARFRDCLEGCEGMLARLDHLADQARTSALAPAPPGQRPSSAATDHVNLREDLRQVDESLLTAEGDWQHGRFDYVRARLVALGAQLDSIRFGIDQLEGHLALVRSAVPPAEASAALAGRAREAQEARVPQAEEIRARIDRDLPRLLERARAGMHEGGAWAAGRLEAAEAASREAELALGAGELERADRRSRQARALAGGLARQLAIGLIPGRPPDSRSLARQIAAALRDACLEPAPTVAWTIAGMALAAWLTWFGASRFGGPTTAVLESSVNLALGAPARSSHALDRWHDGARATDGDLETAWVSGVSLADDQALVVDLGRRHALGKVLVLPQAAPQGNCRWDIDLSDDGWVWHRSGQGSSRCGVEGTRWGATELPPETSARYLRVRPLDWGRSGVAIYEIRAFPPSAFKRD